MSWRRHRLRVLLWVVAIVGVCSCSSAPSSGGRPATPAEPPSAAVVHPEQASFVPATVTIRAGQSVTWVWDDPIAHDIIGDGFGVPLQASGTYTHLFPTAGTFPYHCSIHAGMTGVVVVQG